MSDFKEPIINHFFHYLIVGPSQVGKSSLMKRYCENEFNSFGLPKAGIDYDSRTQDYQGKKVKFQIWDTPGEEAFRSANECYYKIASGFFLVYDASNHATFDQAKSFLGRIKSSTQNRESVPVILVGNKSDLKEKAITQKEAQYFAEEEGLHFIETSAKNGWNVESLFHTMAGKILEFS